jgi:predicted amidohydrolase YtcJ
MPIDALKLEWTKKASATALSAQLPSAPEALNPWWSIWCVVARKTRSGRTICPEEGLGVMDAIRLYTTHSAYAGFEETIKGSIEPGKLADLIVLSEDPFEIPPDGLKEVRVVKTLIGGEVAHSTDP